MWREQNFEPLQRFDVTAWQLCSCECGFVSNDGVESDQKFSGDSDDGEFL